MFFPAVIFCQVTIIKVVIYLNGNKDDNHPFQAEGPLLIQVISHQICQLHAVLKLFIHDLQQETSQKVPCVFKRTH